jgi:glucosamine--fructose-6-phosphate aminotransferase (isomerizing)
VRLIRAFGDGATGRGSGEAVSSAGAGSETGAGSSAGAARPHIVGLTATEGSPLALESDQAFVLSCGGEQAVAATKSVMEQAVFYDVLFRKAEGVGELDLEALADALERTLDADLPPSLADRLSRLTAAPTLYFAGRNDGVGEELALKTNEITRKRSGFLEGTYALHGVEEVLTSDEVVVLVEPFEEEQARFEEVLVGEVGMEVVAIASRQTRFPTLVLPDPADGGVQSDYMPYLQLAAGWNLLVAIGMAAGVNVDKPERARKIGNEYRGG